MHFTKNLLSAALAAALSISCVTAYAAEEDTVLINEAGNSGQAAVILDVQENPAANVFSVTIPAIIPAAIDTNGTITVPNNIQIINNNIYRGIRATDISVSASSNWTLADYDSGDFTTLNGRNLGLTLRNDSMNPVSGKVQLSENNWNIGPGEALPVSMGLKVNPQSKVGAMGTVATISFTLDWSDDESTSGGGEEVPENPEDRDYYLLTFEAGEHGSLKDQETTMKIYKKDLEEAGGSMSVKFPIAYPDPGYAFDKWVVVKDDQEIDVENGHLNLQGGDVLLRAKFKEQGQSTLYVQYNAGDHGKIKQADGSLTSIMTDEVKTDSTGHGSITFPEIVPDDHWMLIGWKNTADGSWATGEGGALKNDGHNNFSVTAVYASSAITATFRCDQPGASIWDEENQRDTNLLVQTIYPDAEGNISFHFPGIKTDGTVVLDKWINTVDGSTASGGAAKLDPENRTMDFTAVFKNAAEIYIHPSTSTGGTISSTAEIHLPINGSVTLPTATPNQGYQFAGWYYDDDTALEKDPENEDSYILDNSKGTYNDDKTRLDFYIHAKFEPVAANGLNSIQGDHAVSSTLQIDPIN